MEVGGGRRELNAKGVGHACDVGNKAGLAAPAKVVRHEHARDLAQGSAAPLRLDIKRQLVGG